MSKVRFASLAFAILGGLFVWVSVGQEVGLARRSQPNLSVQIGTLVPVTEADVAAVEPFIASDPNNASRLFISASTIVPAHGIMPVGYFSDSGGAHWSSAELPEIRPAVEANRLRQGIDTWVSYAPDGSLYYSTLAIVRSPSADTSNGYGQAPTAPNDPWGRASILVFRSDDAGHTFHSPTVIAARSFDAPKTAVGPSGEVVIATTVDGKDPIVPDPRGAKELIAVYRSDDAGKSFRPIQLFGPDALGRNPLNPVVAADSSIQVAWFDHPTYGSHGPNQPIHTLRLLIASAKDGIHFDVPNVAADVTRTHFPSIPRVALDSFRSSPFVGRTYMTWNGGDDKRADVSVAFSPGADGTWSAPLHLHATDDGTALLAAIAVAPNGTVGVMWAEQNMPQGCWNYYFSASADGAVSFSNPQPVTTSPTCADTPENRATRYPGWSHIDTVAAAWPHAGDYLGLTADRNNVFHAVWIDSRDGLFRAYTTMINVIPQTGH